MQLCVYTSRDIVQDTVTNSTKRSETQTSTNYAQPGFLLKKADIVRCPFDAAAFSSAVCFAGDGFGFLLAELSSSALLLSSSAPRLVPVTGTAILLSLAAALPFGLLSGCDAASSPSMVDSSALTAASCSSSFFTAVALSSVLTGKPVHTRHGRLNQHCQVHCPKHEPQPALERPAWPLGIPAQRATVPNIAGWLIEVRSGRRQAQHAHVHMRQKPHTCRRARGRRRSHTFHTGRPLLFDVCDVLSLDIRRFYSGLRLVRLEEGGCAGAAQRPAALRALDLDRAHGRVNFVPDQVLAVVRLAQLRHQTA